MPRGDGDPLWRVDCTRIDTTSPAQHCTPERSRADYENARELAFDIRTELLEAFDTVDAIITPTCSLPAIRAGEEQREIGGVRYPQIGILESTLRYLDWPGYPLSPCRAASLQTVFPSACN